MKIQNIQNIKFNPYFCSKFHEEDSKPLPPDTKGLVDYSNDFFIKQEKEHLSEKFIKKICGEEDEELLKTLSKKSKSFVKNIKK